MTFSIVARCKNTSMFGVAITSSSPAVAARCSFARAGVGAVASQNVTDPSLGPMTLDRMEQGENASVAVANVIAAAQYTDYRQLLAVDNAGLTAIHSGPQSLGIWTQAQGVDVACGGNLLDNESIPQAMVDAFIASDGHLGDRLIHVLQTGLDAGGEAGDIHSAGLKIVDKVSWPVVDLRVDWSESCPIAELHRLWELYKPQLNDYIKRALNPSEAPSYGVPGDEG